MIIPHTKARAIQEWLQYFATTSTYANALLSCSESGNADKDRWQYAVDLIYRLLISGLICGTQNIDISSEIASLRNNKYVHSLARVDPFSPDIQIEWMEWDLYSTERCRELLNKYGISPSYDGDVVVPFMDEIEALFAQHGVSWQASPIIPVMG
ncbi:hypothetical protein [Cupriavidus sp. BIS7]|uniref:hypothetical protein n=1 Tax=Cupriavidus sp. BIS7 TaxID=1217718 RepID=UPI0012F6EBAA|nr:hypothetical protein [Cupriavidus sp. BIS7]